MNDVAQQPSGEAKFDAKFWKLDSLEQPENSYFYCTPAFISADGKAIFGDALVTAGAEDRVLDQELLAKNVVGVIQQVAKFLYKSNLEGEKPKVVLPVNSEAMSVDPVASALTSSCRELLNSYNDQVMFELMNFPPKFSIDYLDNLGILIYPFSPDYIARPNPAWTDFTIFANCNFQGVSFDLKNKAWPADKIQPHLEKFCKSATANRLTPYLLGAATPEIQGVAIDLGFKFICGNAVN
ncbi:MAG: hypothetical protein HON14_05890 [Rhodospirillaceae bacterium]|jgi:hypothetical protein|nr:hypothetical protein [Rhodospirillaceae bacterium]MBT4587948.1 hypothetical protein [Rhodospirillaceae bacterium]MBT4938644.1 hypothetical protein [Rhodospirillaceae bacterium]MBT5941244.1 hypothetical protein [Rhodospirillaceae bacterium]MBT7265877.1 hypothetical protein [Rhodospirillaceae bacterium]